MTNPKDFIFYISGMETNDEAVLNYVRSKPDWEMIAVHFSKVSYTAPYGTFSAIRDYQIATRFHPFLDEPMRFAISVIDISEWINHETEDFIEIFFMFLHDDDSFFQHRYIFTVGSANKQAAMRLYKLASEYLGHGEIVEATGSLDINMLSDYIFKNYPVERNIADRLASIFIDGNIKGIPQLKTIMDDFITTMGVHRDGPLLTKKDIEVAVSELLYTKLYMLYECDVAEWIDEIMPSKRSTEEAK